MPPKASSHFANKMCCYLTTLERRLTLFHSCPSPEINFSCCKFKQMVYIVRSLLCTSLSVTCMNVSYTVENRGGTIVSLFANKNVLSTFPFSEEKGRGNGGGAV